ncbi:TonB-dependent receptor [Aliarcobacter butzleri]|uniref:TonB-denpendent receptor n=1 Tax=Aliarcobacter butzleri L351 TaxID=1447259 RepID=A0A837J675_9BACT|nr:TonB-dependent receptor [Aliarcobacter butzleri]KLE01367.1 TonB-denpendent receptor [Aliarcobacter butzleri L351]KLE13120.1 TonB-denpendent receptor [Aliarcobacter butzleri L350]MDN5046916.1 TonB-dependent receptor [Aliarcobacter butzleri]MDN5059589.1 TonB-dependent receptor [Aliarcobacter butzleri]MDN5097220.1 TonB-dependent receptor [Aliarcobacter butzleri]
MKKISTSLVASFFLATNLFSTDTLETITVTSSLIKSDELNAPFATEIYTKDDIENSKSKDIYDFLSSQTSVNVSPSFGNKFSQLIDLRGYGINDGYQNVAILVNGRKLNNIDMVPQLLSSIPLESVEKIEILKGTGSVSYGDGANAGVINIITSNKNANYVKTYFGDNRTKNGVVSLGYGNEYFVANAYVDYTSTNGSIEDLNSNKDENYNKNKIFSVIVTPTDSLELNLSRSYSNMNTKYGNPISLEQYKNNPNKTSALTEQYFSSYVTTGGFKYDFNESISIDTTYSDEDKFSKFVTWNNESKYNYKSIASKLNYENKDLKFAIGFDGFDGDRISSTDKTNKTNKAGFVSSEYKLAEDLTLLAGFRRENIEYEYNPNNGINLKRDDYINAYDLGANYILNETSSIFANYNRSFLAPDIDRFFYRDFSNNVSFNGFIEPTKVHNYTVGYNNIQKNNKLKISLFRAELNNEMYFEPTSFKNTNIDESHKYGIEIFDKLNINENLYTSFNYSYIIAKIDEENEGNGSYNDKNLPGVSKHNATVNLGYEINKVNTVLSHTYRSSTYAANDFGNNFNEKQEHYHSTDLAISYIYKNVELFGKIQNIFDQRNGLWVANNWGSSDTVYPVNFERTFFTGMKVNF